VIDDTHRAWAYLSRVAEPPCPELSALVAQVGPMEAAQRIRSGIVDDRLARHTDARRHLDCAAADLALLARMGLITADDEEWPGLSFAAFGGVDTRRDRKGMHRGALAERCLAPRLKCLLRLREKAITCSSVRSSKVATIWLSYGLTVWYAIVLLSHLFGPLFATVLDVAPVSPTKVTVNEDFIIHE
jgi:hypothetical protein